MKTNSKIHAIDFMRAVCSLGIIVFHTSCYSSANASKILYGFANGGFGGVLVNIFMMISGGVLYHNYKNIESVPAFYYKRWKSIFPMFYVAWLWRYIECVKISGSFFFAGEPWRLVFTLFGMDGYCLYKFQTYYLLGEWFLGAIILLYILYPFILKLINTLHWKIIFILLPIWLWQIETDWFEIETAHNLIYCTGVFILGILTFKYRLYDNVWVCIVSVLQSILLLFVPIAMVDVYYKEILLSVSLLIVLFRVGEVITKNLKIRKSIKIVSDLSFPIFLVQNVVISSVVSVFNPDTMWEVIGVILFEVVVCMLYAWFCKIISSTLVGTRHFKSMETYILDKIM